MSSTNLRLFHTRAAAENPGPAALTDPILRPEEASAYCRLSQSTLAKRRMRGDPPEFVKLGLRLVGYRLSALDEWLEASRRISTSDSGGAD